MFDLLTEEPGDGETDSWFRDDSPIDCIAESLDESNERSTITVARKRLYQFLFSTFQLGFSLSIN